MEDNFINSFLEDNVNYIEDEEDSIGIEAENNKLERESKKRKEITISKYDNIIEGNFADIPIFSNRRPVKKKLSDGTEVSIVTNENNISLYTWIDSKGRKGAIEIRGSAKYGLPQFIDLEVLLAVMKAHYNISGRNIVPVDDNNTYGFPRVYYFTFNEVAKILGYKTCSGNIIKLIDSALQRMHDAAIHNTLLGGLWDIDGKKYVKDDKKAYHIIDEYESYSYRRVNAEGEKRKNYKEIKSWIKINEFFHNSMCKSYIKFFDQQLFEELRSQFSKRLYLIIHKWRNKKKDINIRLETLYDRMPMDDSIDKYRKREYLTRALKELKNIGYLRDYKLYPTYVHIIYAAPIINGQNKYCSINDLKQALIINYAFSVAEADEYLNLYKMSELGYEYYFALLRYCDYKLSMTNDISDKKGYIKKGLEEKYNIPEQFYI